MLDFPAEALDPTMPPPTVMGVPSAVVLFGVADSAAAQSSIDRILAESEFPGTFAEQQHAGTTIYVDEESGAAYALTDDQLLVAPSADDIIAALDAHASSSTTLSEAGSRASLTAALPDRMARLRHLRLHRSPGQRPRGSGVLGVSGDLLADQPMRGAMALTVEGDRVSLPMVSDPPSGPFAVTNAERGLADEVPGDALYYAEGGNVGASLGGIIGSLKESVGSMPEGAEQLEMVEAALGGNLEDQVAWMGDVAMAAGYDGEQPWGGAIIVPTDMEEARRTMGQLSTFAGLATLDPSIGITVEERDVDGFEVTSVRWSDPSRPTEPPPSECRCPSRRPRSRSSGPSPRTASWSASAIGSSSARSGRTPQARWRRRRDSATRWRSSEGRATPA